MPQYNKFIRIAAGTIVNGDLYDFYNTDPSNYYAAGVHNIAKPYEDIEIGGLDYYNSINPLVVLYNAEKIRQEHFYDKVKHIASVQQNQKLKHVDILLSECLKNKWRKIDFKYCSMNMWSAKTYDKNTVLSKEYQNALKKPIIIVYYGTKPQYVNCRDPHKGIW